jgi:hypothetical protein
LVATDNALLNAFTNVACYLASTVPGATATELANAQNLYASDRSCEWVQLNAILGADGKYHFNGSRHFEIQENTNGLFAQDSWRAKSNLTITYGSDGSRKPVRR